MFSWEIHEFFRSSYCKCFSGDPGLYEDPGHYEEPDPMSVQDSSRARWLPRIKTPQS